MVSFKFWFESQDHEPLLIRKQERAQIAPLYKQAAHALGLQNGKASVLAAINLKDLGSDDKADSGVRFVQHSLQGIFDSLAHLPHFEERVNDTQQWLQSLSVPRNDDHPHVSVTAADLFKKLFGDDSLEMYGDSKWKQQANVEPQPPQDQNIQNKNATSQPMNNQLAGAQLNQQPPMDPNMMATMPIDPNQPPTDPNQPPMNPNMMGNMPPIDPNQPPMNPKQPLQGPGGPFPPSPPGGLRMS